MTDTFRMFYDREDETAEIIGRGWITRFASEACGCEVEAWDSQDQRYGGVVERGRVIFVEMP